MNGVLEMITTKGIGSKSKLLHETRLFRDRLESFGRELALETCKNTQPDEWWKLFGASAPIFKSWQFEFLVKRVPHLGVREIGVYSNEYIPKRGTGWSIKDSMIWWFMKAESYDPIDYESIDKIDVWIVDDEEESFLDYEEIDHMLYEQLDPPRMERQRRRPREDDVDAVEDIEPVEDLEVDDDMDFSAFEQFNVDGNLHDISIGVGEGCSNSGGVMYGDDEEWLRRV
ncbi:UNVERIFIED_CONTAM: hypothetical protein Sradi_5098600 [Sesamum radiatum]|uniref:HAT C-terminal dimerisation domain-containing protein n=1 Tax=Sesamum radiatum TaxID=300843 RepID=A0AAW2M2R9_SESRA